MLRLELGFRQCPCPYWMLIVSSIGLAVIISTYQSRLNGPKRIHVNIGLAQWIWCGGRSRSLVFQIIIDNSVEILREHIVVICYIFTRQAKHKIIGMPEARCRRQGPSEPQANLPQSILLLLFVASVSSLKQNVEFFPFGSMSHPNRDYASGL